MTEQSENSWQEWLAAQRAASTMTVEVIPLAEAKGWRMAEDGAAFGRTDGKFFRMVGVRISVPKEGQREVTSWDQPMLQELGGEGAIVLLADEQAERYLIQARAEPGNAAPGCVLLAATLQASRANLEQAHGGKRPPRAELLDGRDIEWRRLPQDGGKFFRKVNAFAVVPVEPSTVTLNPNERWMDREDLLEALTAGDLNEHLIQALLIDLL